MNADSFRHLYAYHYSENRKMWDSGISLLSDEQFVQASPYSRGAVREQVIHLMRVDDVWFTDVSGEAYLFKGEEALSDRDAIRTYGDAVEQKVCAYLATLTDDILFTKPIVEGKDKEVMLWQVLIHAMNHGTDHRAQILRLLNDFGVQTESQDYIFYVYEHPLE
ncbi:MAG: DinB family protein [Chloroflexota bacterium]